MKLPIANRETATRIVRAAAVAVSTVVLTLPVLAQLKPRCELPETGLPELEKAERLCQAIMPDSRDRCNDFLSELATIEQPSLDQAFALAFGPAMLGMAPQMGEVKALQGGVADHVSEFGGPFLAGREVLKPFVDAAPDDPMLLKTFAFFHFMDDDGKYSDLLRRVLALDPTCGSAALELVVLALDADDEEDANRYLTHGYEHSKGMWKLVFANWKHWLLDDAGAPEADAFRTQVAADVGSRHILVEGYDAELLLARQRIVLDRVFGFTFGQWVAEWPDTEHNGQAEKEHPPAGYQLSLGTWELLVIFEKYKSLRDDLPEEAEAYRAQIASEFKSRPMPLDAENRAESLDVLCNGNALKLRMEARCQAAVQELAARDRRENVPLGADVIEAIDSLSGVAENGDFGEEGARYQERLRQLLEAEPKERRSAEFYVVYSRVLRPTAGIEAEADALRRALDLDPRSGEIGLYLTGALKRLGRPRQEIEGVYRHVIANADDRSVKDMLPADHYAARATEFLAKLPSLAKSRDGVAQLLPLAEQGDREAQVALGIMYDHGEGGVAEDDRQAVFWYRKAAEQGHVDAQVQLGTMYVAGEGVAEDDREAMFWYREAAEKGDVRGQYSLAVVYANGGEGIPVDGRQAVFWYRKAAEQGFASAQHNLALLYDEGERIPKDNDQAVFWYRKAAEQGHAGAQHNLGRMYENGEGVPKDDHQALFWIRKGAENGSAWAQSTLASRYHDGKGVAKDDSQAIFWYRKSAEQGHARSQNNLGHMYESGEGVPKDDDQAVFWYRGAAEQGYAQAQFNLGAMYYRGEGVAKDDSQAVLWFCEAAEQRHAQAQFNLGAMYANGEGVAKDDGQAVFWLRKAAEQGHAQAQSNLGAMYADGDGVAKDDGQAVVWFRTAAEQGYAPAQSNLGAMYANGQGVARDKVQAYAWFSLAATQGNEGARRQSALLRQYMTSAQLAEAQEMSRRLGPPTAKGSAEPSSGDPVPPTEPPRSETE